MCVSEHHGNTKRIAESISEVLGSEILNPYECELDQFGKYDLIGLGSGIYHSRHHKSIFRLLSHCENVSDKDSFIFSTSGFPENRHLNDYNDNLISAMGGKGFNILGVFSCRGYDTWGPFGMIGGINKGHPDYKDISKAKSFAKRMETSAGDH